MRTYTFDDVQELIVENTSSNYTWEVADAKKKNGKTAGYYILGKPK